MQKIKAKPLMEYITMFDAFGNIDHNVYIFVKETPTMIQETLKGFRILDANEQNLVLVKQYAKTLRFAAKKTSGYTAKESAAIEAIELLKPFNPGFLELERIKHVEKDKKIKSSYSVFSDPVKSKETWFAWYPVQTGALTPGFFSSWVWLKRVWRNKCMGVTIYQPLDP